MAWVGIDSDFVDEVKGPDVVIVDADEFDTAEDDEAALRTRKPGLDNSALFTSYAGDAGLNLKTYLALLAKVSSGISIVQA